jgi:hypothetical protein
VASAQHEASLHLDFKMKDDKKPVRIGFDVSGADIVSMTAAPATALPNTSQRIVVTSGRVMLNLQHVHPLAPVRITAWEEKKVGDKVTKIPFEPALTLPVIEASSQPARSTTTGRP